MSLFQRQVLFEGRFLDRRQTLLVTVVDENNVRDVIFRLQLRRYLNQQKKKHLKFVSSVAARLTRAP